MRQEHVMTIGDIIKKSVDAMPPARQRRALSLVRKLAAASNGNQQQKAKMKSEVPAEQYIPKDPALRAIAGIWKDRTDIPKDPIEAVKVIRARMRSRGRRHG
jgi:hypothetical protein